MTDTTSQQKKKKTGKAPAFMFYVGDWIADTRCLSLAAKGAWIDCLAKMWSEGRRGEITYPLIGFARLFGCTAEQAEQVIKELSDMGVCDSVTPGNDKITLICRRMSREAKEREANNNRQKTFRDKKSRESNEDDNGENNGKVTSYSSYSSSFTPEEQVLQGAKCADAAPVENDSKRTEDEPVHRRIWTDGLELLLRSGWANEKSARSFLGKLAQQYGKALLAECIAVCQAENPVNPQEFLVGLLKQRYDEGRQGRQRTSGARSDDARAASAVNRSELANVLSDELQRRGIPID